MKTRTGFVSNSSSSSFVIGVGKPFNTPLEVAEHMIPHREWDSDADLIEKIQKLKLRMPKSPNAVCFKSCNYDTFIAKMGDVFLIQTCHNHQWDLDQYRTACPEEFYDYFGDDGFYQLEHRIDFLHLEHDGIGRVAEWRDTKDFEHECPNCKSWGDYWIMGESIRCVSCGAEPKKRNEIPKKN